MDTATDVIEARFTNAARSKTLRTLITTYGLDSRAVLDVGCCYGEHVALFGPRSTGLSINPAEVEYGKNRGLDIRKGNADEALPTDGGFDVVYSNNLLEHLYSPHQFLYRVRNLLPENGLLVLGVPVIPLMNALMRLKKFRGALADAHINFYTQTTLQKTVERAGWHVETVRGFHFRNPIIDRLMRPWYPHLYIIARPKPGFSYSAKRLKELAGYKN